MIILIIVESYVYMNLLDILSMNILSEYVCMHMYVIIDLVRVI